MSNTFGQLLRVTTFGESHGPAIGCVVDGCPPGLELAADDFTNDLALRILRDAPLHLTEDGLLVCEVGEAEQALVRLLPELPLAWVEFKVGQMGVFVAERHDLVAHHARIRALADAREAGAAPAAASLF